VTVNNTVVPAAPVVGLNVGVAPDGNPVTLKEATFPAYPATAVVGIVKLALVPWFIERVAGVGGPMLKYGLGQNINVPYRLSWYTVNSLGSEYAGLQGAVGDGQGGPVIVAISVCVLVLVTVFCHVSVQVKVIVCFMSYWTPMPKKLPPIFSSIPTPWEYEYEPPWLSDVVLEYCWL
jgi:hypothetical protein